MLLHVVQSFVTTADLADVSDRWGHPGHRTDCLERFHSIDVKNSSLLPEIIFRQMQLKSKDLGSARPELPQ